jgi:UDP-N-acetylmuramate dehydrogenase
MRLSWVVIFCGGAVRGSEEAKHVEDLKTVLGGRWSERLQQDAPLSRFTAARLGGPADWLYIARDSVEELVEVVRAAWKQDMPVRVLGGGANVLVSDAGFRGLVVINHIAQIESGDWHDGRTLSATSGAALTVLARRCAVLGLSGMEWAIAVPGTVGGAVVNNAGAHGQSMADSVADVVVVEADRDVQLYTLEDMQYSYRSSALKAREDRRFLVLMATFRLAKDEPEAIQTRMNEFNSYRKRTQPPGASLGSIFKNPPGDYAGRLIEISGLKGFQIGAVRVSPIHANFFINSDGKTGSASDYYALIQHVQNVVYERQGVMLEPEIEFLGEFE